MSRGQLLNAHQAERVQEAEKLLQAGMALVPVPLGRKGPVTKNWNERSACVTDPSKAEIFADKNIGLAHAYADPSPTCAIDIDYLPGAIRWFEERGVCLRSLVEDSDLPLFTSGKADSCKLLARLPVDEGVLESIAIADDAGRVILEFRCGTRDGRTVQDVAPPSIHPSGNRYLWLRHTEGLSNLSALSAPLLKIWRGEIVRRELLREELRRSAGFAPERPETPRQVATIRDALRYISADCHYDQWRNIVWAILSTQWDCAPALAEEWSRTAPERFEDTTFDALLCSYDPTREPRITAGTIHFYARKGGWNG